MFAILKHCHPLPAQIFVELWTFNSASGKGDGYVFMFCFVLWGGYYCMYVVTCGCCVLYQLNLTGWEGGRGEQRAWTPSPPKRTYFGWETFIWRVCLRPPVEVTLYMNIRMLNVLQGEGGHRTVWLAWTIAMSELCSCTTEWSFQLKQ